MLLSARFQQHAEGQAGDTPEPPTYKTLTASVFKREQNPQAPYGAARHDAGIRLWRGR